MLKKLFKTVREERGFTLVETVFSIVAVTVIIFALVNIISLLNVVGSKAYNDSILTRSSASIESWIKDDLHKNLLVGICSNVWIGNDLEEYCYYNNDLEDVSLSLIIPLYDDVSDYVHRRTSFIYEGFDSGLPYEYTIDYLNLFRRDDGFGISGHDLYGYRLKDEEYERISELPFFILFEDSCEDLVDLSGDNVAIFSGGPVYCKELSLFD